MKQLEFKREYDRDGNYKVRITDRPRRRLDLVPRLLCLLLALIIWIYCVNINESDVVTTFTVKLNIMGAESMKNGMSMYSSSNTTEVKLTVQGTNRDINRFTVSDYKAYIDVSEISTVGWATLKINTELPDGSSLTLLSTDIDAVSVYADVSAETSVPLEIKVGAITQPLNYKLAYEVENGIDSITIKGPKSIIERISKAEYLLEGEFNKSKVISGFPLNFYSTNGELISASNSNDVSPSAIVYDTSSMTINAYITAPVLLKIKARGSDPSLSYDVEQVLTNVVGDPEVLNTMSTYYIDMGDSGVGTYHVNITSKDLGLPESVRLEDESITVTVHVTKNEFFMSGQE